MTRKDYVAIAAALNAARPHDFQREIDLGRKEGWSAAVHLVAGTMAADNPRFDRARFLKACGVQP